MKKQLLTIMAVIGLTAATTNTNAQCVIKVRLDVTPVTCNGLCNGTATVVDLDQTVPLTYAWSNGSTGSQLTGLCAGPVAVTVTQGGENCVFELTSDITQPDALIANCTSVAPIAPGTINASAMGGTEPYGVVWNTNPVQTGYQATNLAVGDYTATVTDANGCTAQTTCTITEKPKEECDAHTQTMGGWGAPPNGYNPASYLYANFAGAFPNGITVGCTNKLKLTSAVAVTNFLPSGSSARALPAGTLTNPGGNYNNVLAGQVVALTISVTMDNYDPNFGASTVSLGNHLIGSGPFTGWSVNTLLAEANNKLGGCPSPYSFSALNNAVSAVNQNYVDGNTDAGFLYCDIVKENRLSENTTKNLKLDAAIYPNPATNNVAVKYTLSQSENITLKIMDLSGRVVVNQNVVAQLGDNVSAIDISNLTPGMYVFTLHSTEGSVQSRITVK